MGVSFPTITADGQIHNSSPGVSWVAKGGVWKPAPLKTALAKNYVLNGAFTVSQQNGMASSQAHGYYPADQWMYLDTLATGAFNCFQQTGAAQASIFGSPGRLSAVCATAQASIASTEYCGWMSKIEGRVWSDLRWGSVDAKQVVARFGFAAPPGSYNFTIRNFDFTRTYCTLLTVAPIEANVWKEYNLVIPGCPDGTWPTDASTGAEIWVTWAIGSALQATPGAWVNGDDVGSVGMSNGAATVGNTFQLSDFGIYADPYKTGVAPPYEMPNMAVELRRCQRYWYRGFGFGGPIATAAVMRGGNRHPSPMRAAPALAVVGVPKVYDLSVTPLIASFTSASTGEAVDGSINTSTLTAGRAGANFWLGADQYIAVSARL